MKKNYSFHNRQQRFFRLLLQILQQSQDPFWQKINVSRIQLTPNFQACLIFYTFFSLTTSSPLQPNSSQIGYLKKMMAPHWKSHHFPTLTFIYDHKLLAAEEIETIIAKWKKNG